MFASMAATGIGGLISGAGSIFGGMAGSASAEYAAAVARNNAIIAERNANYAIMSGLAQSETQDYKTRAQIGATKAIQGSSGFEVNSGSALDVRRSEAELGALDAATIINNAALKASNYRAQSMNFQAEAGLDDFRAGYASTAGIIGAAGSLIGTAGSLSDKWMAYQRTGTAGGWF